MAAKSYEEVLRIVTACAFRDRAFHLLRKGDGFLLQVTYLEADVEHPEAGPVEQRARKWYISPWSTETEIVETAYAACCRSALHVVREHFLYRGCRVYSPHFEISARIALCNAGAFDARPR